ncbi:hypothetical protein [Paenibacillus naphthalenovorans]|nr:hypothetical protein [Paenibacillus naphthalenovorans]
MAKVILMQITRPHLTPATITAVSIAMLNDGNRLLLIMRSP